MLHTNFRGNQSACSGEEDFWFKQYLFETISHIQYIIFYGTGFDKKLLAYKHHLLDS